MSTVISGESKRSRTAPVDLGGSTISIEHYVRLLYHRKWLVLAVFIPISIGTYVFAKRLPNVYSSETVILVDPQKVPEAYVMSTVTGDVRNRLGTLSQQILSATRLQKIIESFNLYPEDRKTMAREDVIIRMRSDIKVGVMSDFGASQDLQAFRISYNGKDPRLVAQVTNQLASLFIEENLKAREQQATGTTEFLNNQLQETRKTLETLEGRLRTFKLQHIGELPDNQVATLQILGQLQAQMQQEAEALARAEQQKTYLQAMMGQVTPVMEVDDRGPKRPAEPDETAVAEGASRKTITPRELLAQLLERYTEDHPDVRKLKKQIEESESKQGSTKVASAAPPPAPSAARLPANNLAPRVVNYSNPVLQSQLQALDTEIAQHRETQQRLGKTLAGYRSKLEVIPVREQQMSDLVRDYEISKAHYQKLLEKQLSAETATELEIRQKGEKFTVLDPAQVPERPSSPNRVMINAAGNLAGLTLGLLIALATEVLGMSITGPEQLLTVNAGIPVLEVIPIIRTQTDRLRLRRRIIFGSASGLLVTSLAVGAVLLYQYRS